MKWYNALTQEELYLVLTTARISPDLRTAKEDLILHLVNLLDNQVGKLVGATVKPSDPTPVPAQTRPAYSYLDPALSWFTFKPDQDIKWNNLADQILKEIEVATQEALKRDAEAEKKKIEQEKKNKWAVGGSVSNPYPFPRVY